MYLTPWMNQQFVFWRMKSLSTVEQLKQLSREGLHANILYYQHKMDRLRQEIQKLEYQYRMNIAVYSWKIDNPERRKSDES